MRILSTTFREGSVSVRGEDQQTAAMFSDLSPEARVRRDHPLRTIRQMTDAVLKTLSLRFARMDSNSGRPSIPPEQWLLALLLQALDTIRSERLLMEEIDYSVLFRWFIGLSLDEPIGSPTVFSKNRDRLLQGDIASAFVDAVLDQARAGDLLSDEHFTVDGTRLEAWASLKSFRRTDATPTPPPEDPGNPTVNFHGETRKHDTHASTTAPDAQRSRTGQGKEAKLAYLGHVLLDNRHDLVVNVCATAATGTAERDAPHWSCCRPRRPRKPSPATNTTTSPRSWRRCVSLTSRRMSRRRPVVRSTAGRPDTPALRFANARAS
jgi:transposase